MDTLIAPGMSCEGASEYTTAVHGEGMAQAECLGNAIKPNSASRTPIEEKPKPIKVRGVRKADVGTDVLFMVGCFLVEGYDLDRELLGRAINKKGLRGCRKIRVLIQAGVENGSVSNP
ncbi:MAG TPA: hypothetical protein VJU77_18015 [Chthoniobacterales bacterium]|nr:hypothetical protein [Chthoniobacterales bacterium]